MSELKKLTHRSFNDYDGRSEHDGNRHHQYVDIEKRVKLAVSCGVRSFGTSTCKTEQVRDAMNTRVRRECYTTADVYRALMKARAFIPGVVRYLGHGKWQFRSTASDNVRAAEWIDISS